MVTLLGDHLQFSTIALEVQGSLLAVANQWQCVPRPYTAHRGIVTGFSSASRKRMLRKSARLAPSQGIFLTLTYPARYPDPRTAKTHLRALLERFRRRYPECSGLWKLEPQKRGAPHFHLLMFDLPFVPFWTLKHWWSDIIADYVDGTLPFVRIEYCDSVKKVSRYVAKYCGKVIEQNSFFNNGSYLHAGPGPGRYWGVFNGPKLPYARRYYVQFQTIDPTGLRDILEVFQLAWEGIDAHWPHGVAVFDGESYKHFSLALTAGLACATHASDILYDTARRTASRNLCQSSQKTQRLNIRYHELEGVLRHQQHTRLPHRKLLQRHLSCDLPLAQRGAFRTTSIRRNKATFQHPTGVGGSIGFTRGLIPHWPTFTL